MAISESKWGFHPCDRETYFALKRLRHLWFKTLMKYAAHSRWESKDPQNRVIRKKIRNENKQCVGYEPNTSPMGEPKIPDFSAWNNRWIDELYTEAKIPKSNKTNVKPFKARVQNTTRRWIFEEISEEDTIKLIYKTLNECQAWYEKNGISPRWTAKEEHIVRSKLTV
jgi:hypothetical protein